MQEVSMIDRLKVFANAVPIPHWMVKGARIAKVLYFDTERVNLFSRASAMAYMTLGSIVPSLAAIFALISLFAPLTDPDAKWFEQFRYFILETLAPEAGEKFVDYLERFLANTNMTKVGTSGFIGLLVILVLLLRNIEFSLNEIWQVPTARSIFRRFIFFWTLITLGTVVLSLVVGILTQFEVSNLLPFMSEEANPETLTSVIATHALILVFFTFIYKIGPNTSVSLKAAFLGGVIATLLFRISSRLYTVYVSASDMYQTVYGALSAIPLFLLWLYVCWLVLLLGAVIAWRFQQGLPTDEAKADLSEHDPLRCLCQNQLRALTPILCVLAALRHFKTANGHGLTGKQIASNLDLSPEWVSEGLRAASVTGWIALDYPVDQSSDWSQHSILDIEIFPKIPPEKVELPDVAQRFVLDTSKWLAQRDPELSKMLREVFFAYLAKLK